MLAGLAAAGSGGGGGRGVMGADACRRALCLAPPLETPPLPTRPPNTRPTAARHRRHKGGRARPPLPPLPSPGALALRRRTERALQPPPHRPTPLLPRQVAGQVKGVAAVERGRRVVGGKRFEACRARVLVRVAGHAGGVPRAGPRRVARGGGRGRLEERRAVGVGRGGGARRGVRRRADGRLDQRPTCARHAAAVAAGEEAGMVGPATVPHRGPPAPLSLAHRGPHSQAGQQAASASQRASSGPAPRARGPAPPRGGVPGGDASM